MEWKTRTVLRRSNSPNVHVLRRAEQSRGVQNVLQQGPPRFLFSGSSTSVINDHDAFAFRATPSRLAPSPALKSRVGTWKIRAPASLALTPWWVRMLAAQFVLWRSLNSHPVHGKQGRVAILFVVVCALPYRRQLWRRPCCCGHGARLLFLPPFLPCALNCSQ